MGGKQMNAKQEDFLARRQRVLAMGGTERVNKQHSRGKLTARERLDLLFDEGTFEEIGMFAEHRSVNFGMERQYIAADGVVTGYGKVNGRWVYAYAQDFTSRGGSVGEIHGKKIIRLMEEALRAGRPVVGMNDSGGGRIQEGNDTQCYTYIFNKNVHASGYIPQVAAIMGSCAGGAAYCPALMDFIISVDKTSKMFLTGPKVIKQVIGEEPDPEVFGTALFHNSVTGVSHKMAVDDYDCIEQIKLYLSYFPQNCNEKPPVYACDRDPGELVPGLNELVPENPRAPFDGRKAIELIADNDSVFEIQPLWGKTIITALARLNGNSVGFIASQPVVVAGVLDINSSDKMAHFVTVCDAFNIPLVWLGDVPGFMPGTDQETGGIIRHGAKTLFALNQATVPKIRIAMRKLYGGATAAMCDDGSEPDLTISWPTAQEAVMGAEGAAPIIFDKELKQAREAGGEEGYQAKLAEVVKEYEEKFNNPYYKARRLYTDMVIMPDETRRVLIHTLEALESKKVVYQEKKHGIFPV